MAAEDRIHAVVDPLIEDLELELVDLVYGGGRLKITIDHPDGLGTDLLTRATRLISHELDLTDPVNGTYTLEITSPGVERTLRTEAHFVRSIGEQVAIKLKPNEDKLRRVRGELISADETAIVVVDEDGERHSLRHDQIAKARTVFDWGPGPKPGKNASSKKSRSDDPAKVKST